MVAVFRLRRAHRRLRGFLFFCLWRPPPCSAALRRWCPPASPSLRPSARPLSPLPLPPHRTIPSHSLPLLGGGGLPVEGCQAGCLAIRHANHLLRSGGWPLHCTCAGCLLRPAQRRWGRGEREGHRLLRLHCCTRHPATGWRQWRGGKGWGGGQGPRYNPPRVALTAARASAAMALTAEAAKAVAPA